ncbi:transcriptional regulator [Spongiactinospora rosea]|uniref:Transcriptional regulator n=1 Tax=Spongiactinospora rosea TaxID=2248750 RepID=A0A366LR00_9ACTN|nr:metalloregulator ArsR/SmtB family transcription factor [Spongiactinospora rosea]RBQ16331.1 transcriptional regulator [Spongiactinospora rosea]
MAQYSAEIDGVFVALADPTRRGVIRRLGHGPTSVGDLAREFPMTLPSFMKHVRTLEANGLIRTVKVGRVRTCVLNRDRLALIDDWLAEQRRIWEERTDRLEDLVTELKEKHDESRP